jgi:hypothetical protein
MLKPRARICQLLASIFLLGSFSYAQLPSPQSPAANDVLTNSDVLKMAEAGVGDEIISNKIRTLPCNFDTGIDAILRLKTAGVSDEVIKAMVAKTPSKEVSPNTRPSDLDDPRSPHESGIYWLAKQGATKRLVRLDPSSHPGQKTRPGFGTANMKAMLSGQHAALRINEQSPEFWFYIDEKSAGLGQSSAAAKPEDFTLARMSASSKERQLIVGHASAFGGITNGVRPEDSLQVDIQKISPGVYKVSPLKPMVAGEYCFVPSGAAGAFVSYGGRLFDFGIDNQQ